MRTKSLVAAFAVSILSSLPSSAQEPSALDTKFFLMMNSYALATVHAENCDRPERFAYEIIVLVAAMSIPDVDMDAVQKKMELHLMLERGRSGHTCIPEAADVQKRLLDQYADELKAAYR